MNVFLLFFFFVEISLNQDGEGQTPLHYAAVCDREAIAELLVKHNADKDVKDNDGKAPLDLCEPAWKGLHSAS